MNDEKTKIKQEKLIQMVSSFCDEKLNEEYRQLSIGLIEKMGRKHEIPFKRGKLEIWASSVIYALGQINFLFDKDFEPHVTPDEICDYFETKKSTVSNKAKKIREMFNLNHYNEEFSIAYVMTRTPSFGIDENSGLIIPIFGDELNIPSADADYDDYEELFSAGLFWYNMGDFEEAVKFFDASLKLKPDDSETLYYNALSLANLDKFKRAVKEIDKAIKIDSNDYRFWNDKGNFLTRLNHIGKAEKSFNKAIKLNPTDSTIWANKGFMYLENNQYDKSFECYQKACELSPDDIHPIIGKVNVCIAREDLKMAQKYLDEVSKIDDENVEYLSSVAHLAMNKKDFEKSIEYWDKCIEIDDKNPMFWVYKAFNYGLWGKEDEFEECLDKALEINPMVGYMIEEFTDEEFD